MIHCMRCKRKTACSDSSIRTTANGKQQEISRCAECGGKKARFLPSSAVHGKGFFNDKVLPNLPELHYVSPFSLKKFSFAGPGTNLKKRLNPDGSWKEWSKPVNRVDALAYAHDLAYNEHSDLKNRRKADDIMIEGLNNIRKDPKAKWSERGDAFLVGLAMKGKRALGLGSSKTRVGKKRKNKT